ncbi:DUF4111 domain-containing protein [Halobacillus salinarum]|uniref:DUF4111 domain-containing protein n=2 Tax=Halobacillus salinarum TaxID=2932257 RepID=A0ABY4EMD2_9BACI|nr:DUF4111 domain-containing protein [Halobacillus salinarum]
MNGFTLGKSDVDILVIVKEGLTEFQQRMVIEKAVSFEAKYPEYPLEFSVLLEEDSLHPVHPVYFDLHYSEYHKHQYLRDEHYFCRGGCDEDLAAHLMVTRRRGKCLYGKPVRLVIGEPDKKDFVQSICFDIDDASEKILEAPVYYVLNLCRTAAYLKEGKILSKKEGGEWGLANLPHHYYDLLGQCLQAYLNPDSNPTFNRRLLKGFASAMHSTIEDLKLPLF